MKKYKLKKDTPTIKAGTMFQEVTSDYDKSRELVRIMPTSGTTSPQWTIDDIINFDEWFEEVKEFEEWKPKEGEKYKCTSSAGGIHIGTFLGYSPIDEFRISIGDAYPLDTPDEVIIKEQKLIPQAMHRLKMAAKKAWFEFNGSEGPDWANLDRDKFAIVYEHWRSALKTLEVTSVHDLGQVYFPTEKSAQAYIDKNNDDLKLLFGVE